MSKLKEHSPRSDKSDSSEFGLEQRESSRSVSRHRSRSRSVSPHYSRRHERRNKSKKSSMYLINIYNSC